MCSWLEFNLTRDDVVQAQQTQTGAFGNDVLYDLCLKHPHHQDPCVAEAKIWLIGRAYAAALERGRAGAEHTTSEVFYMGVGRELARIDGLLEDLRAVGSIDGNIDSILRVYGSVCDFLGELNGCRQQWSLTSKYLHFHFRDLFYIYDSRAAKGLSFLRPRWRSSPESVGRNVERVYAPFYRKVHLVKQHIFTEWGYNLSPRAMDYLLLSKALQARMEANEIAPLD